VKFLATMLSEDGSGASASTMRVASLLVVLFILAPRCWVAVQSGTIPSLSTEEVGMVLGTLGIKAYQRGKEESQSLLTSAATPPA
jgi:hypothetical protein